MVWSVVGLLLAPSVARAQTKGERAARPAWATAGVPDTVWILVEASSPISDKNLSKALLQDAERQARAALEGHAEDVEKRFALAVTLGLRADREYGRTKVQAASEMYRQLTEIPRLDPDNGRAHGLMGRLVVGVLHMGTVTRWIATGLLGGAALKEATWDDAERHLVAAVGEAPEVADHHLQLAYLYRDTHRPALALIEAHKALAIPATSPLEQEPRAEAEVLGQELSRQEAIPPTEMDD